MMSTSFRLSTGELMVLSDVISGCVFVAYMAILVRAQLVQSRLVRWASYALMVFTLVLTVRTYQSLIKGLSRPSYTSRAETVAQNRYHLLHDLNAQRVMFVAEDNLNISGYLITREKPQGNILVCHGWRSSKELIADYVDAFPGYNVFVFDFRAHGESEGQLMTLGIQEIKDARAALRFVQTNEKTKGLPTYGIGISMGGAMIARLAHEQPQAFKAVVIDSSFACLHNSAVLDFKTRTSLPVVPFFSIFKLLIWVLTGNDLSMCPVDYLKDLPIPKFVIYARDDERVAMADAQRLIDVAQQSWIVDGCNHGGICSATRDEYGKRVAEFFSKS